jgi:hypothetical protein
LADGILDGLIVVEDAEREIPLLEIEPQPLDRIEFRRAWRQRNEGHAGWHFEIFCTVPSGLIEDEHDVLVCVDRLGKFIEIDLHRMRRHFGHHERKGVIRARLDGTEDVGECVALIALAGWPLATRVPAVTDAALLADARFVLEKQADPLCPMCIANRF